MAGRREPLVRRARALGERLGTHRGPTWVAAMAVLAATAWLVVGLVRVIAARIGFPMEVEWCEGHALEQAWRATHEGWSLYGDPSVSQSPPHPPLYFLVLGVLLRITGLHYWAGRAVSVLSTVAFSALAYRVVEANAAERWRGRLLGLVAVGAIVAAYTRTGAWYDLARVDSLALALFVGGVVALAPSRRGAPRPILAALLVTGALATKLTYVVFTPWLVVFAMVRGPRSGLRFALGLAAACGLGVAILELASDGWFGFWVLLPLSHPLERVRLGAAEVDLLGFAPYLLVTIGAVAYAAGRRWASPAALLWGGLLLIALPTGLLQIIKIGGANNGHMATLVIAPVATLLVATDALGELPRGRPARELAFALGLAVAAGYLARHRIPPALGVPTPSERRQEASLAELVSSLPGTVVVPRDPFLGRQHDESGEQVEQMGYVDLQWGGFDAVDESADILRGKPDWVIWSEWEQGGGFRASPTKLSMDYRLWCRIDPPYAPGFPGKGSDDWLLGGAPRYVYRARRRVPTTAPFGPLLHVSTCDNPAGGDRHLSCMLGSGFELPYPGEPLLWAVGPRSQIDVVVDREMDVRVALHVQELGVPGVEANVVVGGKAVAHVHADEGSDLEFTLHAVPGDNIATLEYTDWNRPPERFRPKDPRALALGLTRASCHGGVEHHALFP